MDEEATAMRQQMEETLAGMAEKLKELELEISGTVRTVKDSVNTVRDSFDLKLQVRQRPWTLFAGAAALGFLGGFRSSSRLAQDETSDGNDAPRRSAAAPGWLANLGNTLQPEIAELKGIAIGTLIGLVREIITNQMSRPKDPPAGESGKDGR